MTLLVDAAPLVALADRRDSLRHAVREVLEAERGALVIAAPVTAEADYLLGQRIGQAARLAFLEDLAAGRFTVECLEPDEYAGVTRLLPDTSESTPSRVLPCADDSADMSEGCGRDGQVSGRGAACRAVLW